jgi:hypothetical protein
MTHSSATSRYAANLAPGNLELVQELANTIGVGAHPDLLASTGSGTQWLVSLTGTRPPALDRAALVVLRRMRSAVRRELSEDATDLGGTEGAADLVLRLRFDHEGVTVHHDDADVVNALGGRVAVALIEARATGALSRLKLCANPRCRVAFFDQSRNGGGRWHSSTRCGNAARVRLHRSGANGDVARTGPEHTAQ